VAAGQGASPLVAIGPHETDWNGLLVGAENALAIGAARSLATGGAGAPSRLVVYGPAGVGKSRLLEEIAEARRDERPEAIVTELGGDELVGWGPAAAAEPGGWAALRARLRGPELLVLDDLHALERRPAALDELAHTLDALDAAGAGAVVATREPPSAWARSLPRRLASRLLGGLVVRLDPPGPELRRRFLDRRARERGLAVASGVLDALAAAPAEGFGPLEGRLARVELAARVGRRPDDQVLVAIALDDEPTAEAPAIAAVARIVAAHYGLPAGALRGPSRRRAVAGPRAVALWLARDLCGAGPTELGRYFGRRDPATVRHACASAAARAAADPALAAFAAAARSRFGRSNV